MNQPQTSVTTMHAYIALSSVSFDLYHGSPRRTEFDAFKTTFFTQDLSVARQYAKGQTFKVGGPTKVDTPRVYSVKVTVTKAFDMRGLPHKDLYESLREKYKEHPLFEDDPLPKLSSQGFISSHSGLPTYSHVQQFKTLFQLEKLPYDSMWVDEGSQGISLAVFDPRGKVEVLGTTYI
jgi:hypothetical protein